MSESPRGRTLALSTTRWAWISLTEVPLEYSSCHRCWFYQAAVVCPLRSDLQKQQKKSYRGISVLLTIVRPGWRTSIWPAAHPEPASRGRSMSSVGPDLAESMRDLMASFAREPQAPPRRQGSVHRHSTPGKSAISHHVVRSLLRSKTRCQHACSTHCRSVSSSRKKGAGDRLELTVFRTQHRVGDIFPALVAEIPGFAPDPRRAIASPP